MPRFACLIRVLSHSVLLTSNMVEKPEIYVRKAIDLAIENVRLGRGGPFGALVLKDGKVIATGTNLVTSANDPTAHAEIVAIRAACASLASFELEGCEIYSSCEPCPMCLGAIYWSRAERFYFACGREDAARAQFDDSFIYDELNLSPGERSICGYQLSADEGREPFEEWAKNPLKIHY
jgi:guanine deaminase